MFLEALRDTTLCKFAYNNIKYSRYLTLMVCEMFSLETSYREVHLQFIAGKFTVQLPGKNTLGWMEPENAKHILIPKDIILQKFVQQCFFWKALMQMRLLLIVYSCWNIILRNLLKVFFRFLNIWYGKIQVSDRFLTISNRKTLK